ncbi:MAG: NupC/NupG family nucleoside CNT transporter [Thermoguttaceae bacterium]
MQQIIPFLGILVFTTLAWSFSRNLKGINIRLVFWTFAFLIVFSLFVFRTGAGQNIFSGLNTLVIATVDAALEGPKFVFGSLADPVATEKNGIGFLLFFQGLATILVISALLAILYHVGIMSRVLKLFSVIFSKLTRISGAESLAATANVFVGNESLLAIRPCLPKLTRSEFCVVLASCMATISANVIGIYVGALRVALPSIAGHLVSASILSVPAAVLLAKLAVPETEKPETLGINVEPDFKRENTLIEAILGGGEVGYKMIVGIASMLIAVVGLLAIANALLGWCGNQLNPHFGWTSIWSIQGFLGYLFYPFAWLMGVPAKDVPTVANLLGTRMIATEIPAYFTLSGLIASGEIEARSAIIAAYALCGFAHIPSLAIYVGGATALAPDRKSDIAAVAWKALVIATLACFVTGALAGMFFQGDSVLIPTQP